MILPSCRPAARLVGAVLGVWSLLCGPLSGPLAAQPFTFSLLRHDLPAVSAAAVSWVDADNDGDLDALISGRTNEGSPRAGLYRNDSPRGRHAEPVFVAAASVAAVAFPAAAWGDYDRDGDLDLVLTGSLRGDAPYAATTHLYRNDGAGGLAPVEAPFAALHSGAAAWGDVDNDGDADLLLAGTSAAEAPYTPATLLYRNDTPPGGAAAFTPVPTDLPALVFGDAAWGDLDGDGDLDLALTGYGAADAGTDAGTGAGFVTAVYRNDLGTLVDAQAALPGLAFSTVDWGDGDGDGDLDLLLSGGRTSPFLLDGEVHLYRNDGGAFAPLALGLSGVLSGEAGWGDYDGDGDLDLLVLGATRPLDRYTARVYENGEGDAFHERTLLVGALLADAAWGDYDGDGDLDLLAAGLTQPSAAPGDALPPRTPATHLYRNDRAPLDAPPPAAPAALHADVRGGAVALAWGTPAETPGPLTYELRVGTTPGGADVVAPAADAAHGTRRLTTPGAAATPTWTLRALAPGTYYWGVQSVSAAFAGSGFVDGGAFTVAASTAGEDAPAVPSSFAVTGIFPNPSSGAATVAFTLPASSPVTLRVFNLLGETVRTIHGEALAGARTLAWDGADETGRPAASGVYVYELRTAEGVRSGHLVRTR